MKERIEIIDLEASYLTELTDEGILREIGGGAEPSTDTSLANDIGYAVGWVHAKVVDAIESAADWLDAKLG